MISEVEKIMNSHPYMEQNCMDQTTGFPLSSEQALGPRASYGRLEIDAGCNEATILERAANVKILAISFWKMFSQIILPGRLSLYKWSTSHENIKVGDIVHISSSRMMESGFRMAIVVEAKPGDDGLVRTVTVRTPTQHIKEVSIHCLKLIVSTK
ncbi:MAG: hypothetical protein GY696_33445, partial [Gammaproteobacteria bacterium]|nr:hypothetical protein [Gammaproteobacteria bacterium]